MRKFKEVKTVLIWQPKPHLYSKFSCCFGKCKVDATMIVDEKKWMPTKRTWVTEQKGYCSEHGPREHCPADWFGGE